MTNGAGTSTEALSQLDCLNFKLARERVISLELQIRAASLELGLRRKELEAVLAGFATTYQLGPDDTFDIENGNITRKPVVEKKLVEETKVSNGKAEPALDAVVHREQV